MPSSLFENYSTSTIIALAIGTLIGCVLIIYILSRLFRRVKKISSPDRARNRAPRLGIIDAFDLGDGQRQLVLLRRDNVEHLLLIGGPNDTVVETNIIRTPIGKPASFQGEYPYDAGLFERNTESLSRQNPENTGRVAVELSSAQPQQRPLGTPFVPAAAPPFPQTHPMGARPSLSTDGSQAPVRGTVAEKFETAPPAVPSVSPKPPVMERGVTSQAVPAQAVASASKHSAAPALPPVSQSHPSMMMPNTTLPTPQPHPAQMSPLPPQTPNLQSQQEPLHHPPQSSPHPPTWAPPQGHAAPAVAPNPGGGHSNIPQSASSSAKSEKKEGGIGKLGAVFAKKASGFMEDKTPGASVTDTSQPSAMDPLFTTQQPLEGLENLTIDLSDFTTSIDTADFNLQHNNTISSVKHPPQPPLGNAQKAGLANTQINILADAAQQLEAAFKAKSPLDEQALADIHKIETVQVAVDAVPRASPPSSTMPWEKNHFSASTASDKTLENGHNVPVVDEALLESILKGVSGSQQGTQSPNPDLSKTTSQPQRLASPAISTPVPPSSQPHGTRPAAQMLPPHLPSGDQKNTHPVAGHESHSRPKAAVQAPTSPTSMRPPVPKAQIEPSSSTQKMVPLNPEPLIQESLLQETQASVELAQSADLQSLEGGTQNELTQSVSKQPEITSPSPMISTLAQTSSPVATVPEQLPQTTSLPPSDVPEQKNTPPVSSTVKDPFSVEEIEAEFARLLGRASEKR